MDKTNCLG
uniref:Uncharacterized protein n=1 Tax=Anguilla anguilla TaxID=7936 RepID=A0A0E9UQN4_ANGAN